jgi:hypothetical protein
MTECASSSSLFRDPPNLDSSCVTVDVTSEYAIDRPRDESKDSSEETSMKVRDASTIHRPAWYTLYLETGWTLVPVPYLGVFASASASAFVHDRGSSPQSWGRVLRSTSDG